METFLFWFLVTIGVLYITPKFIQGFLKGFNHREEKKAAEFLAGIKPEKGQRTPDEILGDIIVLTKALDACKQELVLLIKEEQSEIDSELPLPKAIPIVFNSEEVACRFQGVDVPKYIKDENGRWFEFESLAAYDDLNRAIVDDSNRDYVTIRDDDSNSAFFFRHIDEAPVLKEKLEQA